MTTALEKFQSLVHLDVTILTTPVKINASPYEGDPAPISLFGPAPSGITFGGVFMPAERPIQSISALDSGWSSKVKQGFAENRIRKEMKLVSAEGSNGGWRFQWMVRGRPSLNANYRGGMGIGCRVTCYSGEVNTYTPIISVVVVGIIDKVGGVQSVMGPENEAYTLITAHTPDNLLAQLNLSRLPFIKHDVVYQELVTWQGILNQIKDMKTQIELDRTKVNNPIYPGYTPQAGSIQDILGDIPDDYPAEDIDPETGYPTDSNYGDIVNKLQAIMDDIYAHHPLGGFANYRDDWTATPGELMGYTPPNQTHFRNKITPQHNAFEVCQNHVRANNVPLLQFFGSNFNPNSLMSYDPGVNVLDAGPGSVQDILHDSTNHGRFRYWWAADSTMRYVDDYCSYPLSYGPLESALDFVVDAGMSCTLKVTMTYDDGVIINRVCVRGQWAAGNPDNPGDPLEGYFANAQGTVYPAGRHLGDTDGSDIVMEDYQGINTAEQARRVFNQANCAITAEISNFPFAALAFTVFNKIVKITAVDPLGAFNFDAKEFSCESSSYSAQSPDAPGGGYPTATFNLKEIKRN